MTRATRNVGGVCDTRQNPQPISLGKTGVRRRLCCPQGFQKAPSSVAGSRPLFLTPWSLNHALLERDPNWLFSCSSAVCLPHPSHTQTCPKPTGDQVLGQAEPTLSWGGDWKGLLPIPAPPRLSESSVGSPSWFAGFNPRARQEQRRVACLCVDEETDLGWGCVCGRG